MMRRSVLFCLAACLALFVSACGSAPTSGTSDNGGTVDLVSACRSWLTDPNSIDPLTSAAAQTRCLCVQKWLADNNPTQISADAAALDQYNHNNAVELPFGVTSANTTCETQEQIAAAPSADRWDQQ